jgi:hypothetical protein
MFGRTGECACAKNNVGCRWAGQTLGNNFESDGRLKNQEVIQTIQCDTAANTCNIPLKAPSLALVFLTEEALANSSPDPAATQSFETSILTNLRKTATIGQDALATSNGRGGTSGNQLGSTSPGSAGAARAGVVIPGIGVLVAVVAGAIAVGAAGGRW